MLRLLLDIHIKADVATGVAAQRPDCAIESLRDWKRGRYRAAPDPEILAAAYEDGMTLVTYDLKSIPLLLRAWGAMDRPHAGVIFVDHRTILAHDVGGHVRGLVYLWDIRGHEDWTNVVDYLRPAAREAP